MPFHESWACRYPGCIRSAVYHHTRESYIYRIYGPKYKWEGMMKVEIKADFDFETKLGRWCWHHKLPGMKKMNPAPI